MKYSRLTITLCLSALFALSLMPVPPVKAHADLADLSTRAQGIERPTSVDADSNDVTNPPIFSPLASSHNSLYQTNGNKVSGIHAVFMNGRQLIYARYTSGAWVTSPVPLAYGVSSPTIAVVGGYVGVVYRNVTDTKLYYSYRRTNSLPLSTGEQWHQVSIQVGKQPALVSYGSKMHLTWVDTNSVVKYTSFPPNPTGAVLTSTFQLVSPDLACGTDTTSLPSIAVTGQAANNTQPRVRIAYFYQLASTNVGCSPSFGFYVSESPPTGVGKWNIVGTFVNTLTAGTNTVVSMSLAANGRTGDYYVHVGGRVNGVSNTVLYRQNAWTPTPDPWKMETILADRASVVDVESDCRKVRIAVSEYTSGIDDYGRTWYRTAAWTSGASPTWLEPEQVVSSTGKDPQALFDDVYSSSGFSLINRTIHAVYEERFGSGGNQTYDVSQFYLNSGFQTINYCGPIIYNFTLGLQATPVVYRPGNGTWYFAGGVQDVGPIQFGMAGDQIAPGDYDGDSLYDVAVFRPSNGTWYMLNSSTNSITARQLGTAGDILTPADFDGDGLTDVAVFRPTNSTWYIDQSTDGLRSIQFGASGDVPVTGDFDGDAFADLALFRPANGTWYIMRSSGGLATVPFGASGDKTVAGDYNGDGLTDVAVFRPSTGRWYTSLDPATNYGEVQWGQAGDTPVPADYDGDGRLDIAVFRPSNGNWYIRQSSDLTLRVVLFGTNGDVPIPSAYVR